ncbi:rfaE bifunctional protein [Desulfurispirillum indicum S5]|uniref:Bifunctional protein HldE n=1 Tax=Desulfurispirillum indicum (strain ATCC BAA-1389 / DSM 22839 / S5) TaxID=653733 RepID=E6W4X0_DESIS|nr:bifunctional D-glycero-beta-D-manno-heptose-7-phosphate kinase/D-glycero-beta-D-manno-heptose 1-phosphate adenylyltransferase HldE [Desulfurispirillum indicum]ADU64848.1 rfaE bifunctional protein [Desulfurispirillum indicum S5]
METFSYPAIFEQFPKKRILVAGDLMIDEYLWGQTERISPEAPVPVVDIGREDTRLGGAGNVLHNLRALGAAVDILGVVGTDAHGVELCQMLQTLGVGQQGILREPDRRTSRKTRIMASHQQMMRIDRESRQPISADSERQAVDFLQRQQQAWDAIVISDYGKGLLTTHLVQAIISMARQQGIPVLVDPKGDDYRLYRGATTITPNRREASIASGIRIADHDSLLAAGRKLLTELNLDVMTITRSEEGMSLFFPQDRVEHIPTMALDVFDVTGAGDTVISVMALCCACGLDFVECGRIANAAAGVVVGKVGTSTASAEEILQRLQPQRSLASRKIKSLPELLPQVEQLRRQGKKILFTNGCFDLLHHGHITYLQDARKQGDVLILGLNSDASIRRLKGPSRPIIGQHERAVVLAALEAIDYVVIFDEDTPLELIAAIQPQGLIKGGDYRPEQVVGREIVEAGGGEVIIIPFVEGSSTTGIIERILANQKEREQL